MSKVYKEESKTETRVRVTKVVCDLCGITSGKYDDWAGGGLYTVNETEVKVVVRQKEGYSCPDGGSGVSYEIDLCPSCFKDRLVVWLKEQGAKIEQGDWDW